MKRGRTLSATMATLALLALWAPANAQTLKKVQIAVGSALINVGYPTETLPTYLGYFKEAGYEVELIAAGGTLQAIQLLVAGNVDFAEVNAAPVIQARVTHNLPIHIAMTQTAIDWSLAVMESSTLKEAKDFKGKKIGVFSMATGMLGLLERYLAGAGVSSKDYELVSVGIGAPAVNAIRTGQVDALYYWGSGIASFRNALPMRTIHSDEWKQYPDYSLAVMQSTIRKDPQKVIDIAKAMAKATAFALASPDCARRVYNAHNKRELPVGETQESLAAKDMNIIGAKLAATANGLELGAGKYGAAANIKAFDNLQAYMVSTKEIAKSIPSSELLTSIANLTDKINDFDAAQVQAAARACKVAS